MDYEIQTHALIVKPLGKPIFSEMATIIRLEDEGDGPFVVVEQIARRELGQITIDEEEWPAIRDAISRMLKVANNLGRGNL